MRMTIWQKDVLHISDSSVYHIIPAGQVMFSHMLKKNKKTICIVYIDINSTTVSNCLQTNSCNKINCRFAVNQVYKVHGSILEQCA